MKQKKFIQEVNLQIKLGKLKKEITEAGGLTELMVQKGIIRLDRNQPILLKQRVIATTLGKI